MYAHIEASLRPVIHFIFRLGIHLDSFEVHKHFIFRLRIHPDSFEVHKIGSNQNYSLKRPVNLGFNDHGYNELNL
jgi:hypothetical protein